MTDDMVLSNSVLEHLREALADGTSEDPNALRLHLASLLAGHTTGADEAFSLCRQTLGAFPGDLDALELAARASRTLGQLDRAARYEDVLQTLTQRAPATDSSRPAVIPLRVVEGGRSGAWDVERPGIGLGQVAGMVTVKRRLNLAFLGPLRNPQLRKLYGKSLRGGLLLWGPPGCGKTFVARALAGELGAKFLSVGLNDILDMYTGQSERNLHEMFELARRSAPCVLFIDELDALGQRRSKLAGPGRNVVAQLLSELDGVSADNEGVFVLGATNHPWDVDSALKRPGRLDRTVLVLPPDTEARRAILAEAMRERPAGEDLDFEYLTNRTAGFSGADLVHLVESASELALADSIETGEVRPIQAVDFTHVLTEVRPSTDGWIQMARNYAEFGNERGAYDDLLAYLRVQRRNPI